MIRRHPSGQQRAVGLVAGHWQTLLVVLLAAVLHPVNTRPTCSAGSVGLLVVELAPQGELVRFYGLKHAPTGGVWQPYRWRVAPAGWVPRDAVASIPFRKVGPSRPGRVTYAGACKGSLSRPVSGVESHTMVAGKWS